MAPDNGECEKWRGRDLHTVIEDRLVDALLDADGSTVASEGDTALDSANAEFICRAANNHEALIDALRTIEALICDKTLCGHFTAEEIRDVVHAALAKATQKG